MTQVAMREIRPQLAGAASGVLNTNQQMGAVIGSAAVGALLQSSLASNLQTEAVNRSAALPAQFRQQFIDGFSHAASTGLQVGQGQTGAAMPAAAWGEAGATADKAGAWPSADASRQGASP
jgi:hypothetical protein